MGIRRQTAWALALAAQIGVAGQAAVDRRTAEERVELLVGVHNYAGVPQATLAAAEENAAGILDRAGIAVKWVECPVSSEDKDLMQACYAVKEHGGLFLKILPKAMAERLPLSRMTFGLAIESHAAYVFAHRVLAAAADRALPEHTILGVVMAHELGHLLLGAGAHSDKGIMSEDLPLRTFRLVAHGVLPLFNPEQVRQIHTRLSARTRAQK